MSKTIIYLGNISHPKTKREMAVPLAIGNLASYCKGALKDQVEIKLFNDAEVLCEAVRNNPPHILGLSYFMWNRNITLETLKYCRKFSPDTLNVLGGPHVARTIDAHEKLLEDHDSIDIIVLDQGEVCFLDVVNRYISAKQIRNDVLSQEIPGCSLRLTSTKEVVRGAEVPEKALNLSELPSPYLPGYLEEFVKQDYLPIIETSRGCPFTCTFCSQADRYYTKVFIKDEDTVYAELEYLMKHARRREVILADNNFGIRGERDVRIASFILDMNKRTGFPSYVHFGNSKRLTEHSFTVIKKMAEITGVFTLGIQTFSEKVLDKIGRNNLNIEEFKTLGRYAEANGIRQKADMIFGLPEETLESYFDSMSKVISLNISSPQTRNLKLIPGSPVSDFLREEYKYKSKFRPISNSFGEYRFDKTLPPVRIIETEEIAYSNINFNEDDYFTQRQFVFFIELVVSYGGFSETIKFLLSRGILLPEILRYVLASKNKYEGLSEIMDMHNDLSRYELFDTDTGLIGSVVGEDKLWQDLISGQGKFLKVNLALVGYCLFHNASALDNFEKLIVEFSRLTLSSDDMVNLTHVLRFDNNCRLVKNYKSFSDKPISSGEIVEKIVCQEEYDFILWRKKSFAGDLKDYKCHKPSEMTFYVFNYEIVVPFFSKNTEFSTLNYYEQLVLLLFQHSVRRVKLESLEPRLVGVD